MYEISIVKKTAVETKTICEKCSCRQWNIKGTSFDGPKLTEMPHYLSI